MIILKKTCVISLIALIVLMSAVNGRLFSYAEVDSTGWTQVSSNEQLVQAFKAYCKSRNLAIEGSVADAVTTFTTDTFNNICNTLGINSTQLQAELKYKTDSNVGLQWLFTASGVDAFNRIFAEFLQNNDLSVGDNIESKNVYNGKDIIIGDNRCTVFVTNNSLCVFRDKPSFLQYGTPFIYSRSTLISLSDGSTISFPINNNIYQYRISVGNGTVNSGGGWKAENAIGININGSSDWLTAKVINGRVYRGTDGSIFDYHYIDGYCGICEYEGNFYLGVYSVYVDKSGATKDAFYNLVDITNLLDDENIQNVNVYLTTNNTTINNNNYEGDTIINNNGDTIVNPDNPSDPDNPITPIDPTNPGQPTVPDDLPTPDLEPSTDWNIEFPDLEIPNWILNGKQYKFPFDIPFNVMYALSLLQAEPEAPSLQGTLDLGVYEWDYDLDLSDFDGVASICRNMEFLLFLTGLMLMTRKLIWG